MKHGPAGHSFGLLMALVATQAGARAEPGEMTYG